MDLKLQIQSLQKRHLTVKSYLDQKRSLADRLRLIGSPISDVDLQMFVLHGLSIEYDSLVVSLNSRSTAVPFNELAGLLLTHEQRLLKHALNGASSSFSTPVSFSSSNVGLSVTPQVNLLTSSILGSSSPSNLDLMAQFSGFLASRGAWRGKKPDSSFVQLNSDRPICQLCFKRGHIIDRCYKHFDSTYKPPPPRSQAPRYRPPPQALCVQPGPSFPELWYLDSGASAHVSPDLNAFTAYSPYHGPDKLCWRWKWLGDFSHWFWYSPY
jgi:gag-polypeptide of LTR copia-type